jgi:hypothetical protein
MLVMPEPNGQAEAEAAVEATRIRARLTRGSIPRRRVGGRARRRVGAKSYPAE